MEEGKPSSTAINSAMMRAAHLFLDDDPKIFRDDFAGQLAGFENEATLRDALEARHQATVNQLGVTFAEFYRKSMRGIMTVRSRYSEEELAKAVDRSVAQYVILGAGLDSFAYRRKDLTRTRHVFVPQPRGDARDPAADRGAGARNRDCFRVHRS